MKTKFLILFLVITSVFSCGSKDNKKEQIEVKNTVLETAEKLTYEHTLTWTAFKTPERIGVSGTFDVSNLSVLAVSETLLESLKGAQFSIVTTSVNTKDGERDKKLKTFFFSQMEGDILGYFGTFKEGKVPVFITMNGITKEKEFTYETFDNTVKIKGSIDIISDFKGNKALEAIHEICKDLHAGKTWSDVEINVDITKK